MGIDIKKNKWNPNICGICRETFYGTGYNGWPLCKGRCCSKCNATKVIPKRLNQILTKDWSDEPKKE